MKKINLKYLFSLIFIFTIFFIISYANTFANDNTPKYIYGKVIYADDKSPVNDGLIKVFKINEVNNQGSILESTIIESNGEFKLLIQPIQSEHGIKIMAYPNDYDSQENPFEPKVFDADRIFANSVNEHIITIEVERIRTKVNKSQGSKKTTEESNPILKQNFPNPFNPSTLIRFELPQTSNVTLKIYNMNGESVATLVENKNLAKGLNELEFNASSLPSGIYVYSLTAGNFTETRKMMLLK